jgi:hypothetical protein
LGVAALDIERVEFLTALFLAREELYHRHPGQRLGQVGVECGQPFTDLTVNHAGAIAEELQDEEQRRQRAHRPHRQVRVEGEHDADDDQHRQHIVEHRE